MSGEVEKLMRGDRSRVREKKRGEKRVRRREK